MGKCPPFCTCKRHKPSTWKLPVKCQRCGEVFKWALDLVAHTDTCPMPRVTRYDGEGKQPN